MRNRVQAKADDPVSLYGFFLAPDGLDALIAPSAETPSPTASDMEAAVDYARLGRAIRRNREWYR